MRSHAKSLLNQEAEQALQCGGEGGIRTRGRLLTYTRFPGVRLKPLIHLSGDEASIVA